MANHETVIYDSELVHCYVAIRRKKENPDLPNACVRQIIRDVAEDLEILKSKLKFQTGIWRIHRTVNRRSVSKAWKVLQHKMIDDPELPLKLESAWRTALLSKQAKGERKFQLDVDTKNPDEIAHLESVLSSNNIEVLESADSPNGRHYVTPPFDFYLLLGNLEYVDLQRDGYIFVELYE